MAGEEIDFSNKTKESNRKDRCIKLVRNVRGAKFTISLTVGQKLQNDSQWQMPRTIIRAFQVSARGQVKFNFSAPLYLYLLFVVFVPDGGGAGVCWGNSIVPSALQNPLVWKYTPRLQQF